MTSSLIGETVNRRLLDPDVGHLLLEEAYRDAAELHRRNRERNRAYRLRAASRRSSNNYKDISNGFS